MFNIVQQIQPVEMSFLSLEAGKRLYPSLTDFWLWLDLRYLNHRMILSVKFNLFKILTNNYRMIQLIWTIITFVILKQRNFRMIFSVNQTIHICVQFMILNKYNYN